MPACVTCGVHKDAALFYSRKGRGTRRKDCKLCCRKAQQARYQSRYAADPTAFKAASTQWYAANAKRRQSTGKRWRAGNMDRCAASCARHRSAKLNATVPWAESFLIDEAYSLAQLRTRLTGVLWAVDHVVPLQSSRVCGLHVQDNLQVITKRENSMKCNSYWPGM